MHTGHCKVTSLNLALAAVFLSLLIVATTELYIWLLLSKARWFVVVPVALTFFLWRIQKQTATSLGLAVSELIRSFRQWRILWLVTIPLFLVLGRHILPDVHVLFRGVIYFVWCSVQQVLYQSIICRVLRNELVSLKIASLVSGLLFAVLHLPNPVLVPATLVWGICSCVLFAKCRSALGLALLQVMLSSMLMWLTPYQWHHGFRTGPSF